jgi:hypothetical protein
MPLPDLPYRTLWIAGMPRCGSMWCFNLARAMLEAAGYEVKPGTVPRSTEEMLQAGLDGLGDAAEGRVTVVKVHTALPEKLPRSRIVAPVRDLRDAMVSYIRFARVSFDQALEAARGWAELCDHYARWPAAQCWRPGYAEITGDPAATAAKLAAFIGVSLEEAVLTDIVARFDKEVVAAKIAEAEAKLASSKTEGVPVRSALVIGEAGDIRAFDAATGFQSRHVSDYRDGGWREAFSAAEKARIDAEIGDWLKANGFGN